MFFQAFCFLADKELLREPRIVRVGLIQNSIGLPTTAHFLDQKRAIFEKLRPIIDAAGAAGVNVLCLQVCYALLPCRLCFIDFCLIFSSKSIQIKSRKHGQCHLPFVHGRRGGVNLQSL